MCVINLNTAPSSTISMTPMTSLMLVFSIPVYRLVTSTSTATTSYLQHPKLYYKETRTGMMFSLLKIQVYVAFTFFSYLEIEG